MFPAPVPVVRRPCLRCGVPTRVDRAVSGYGPDCAERLGLTVATPRLRVEAQTGPDLFTNDDEEDACDGWDR